MRHSEIYGAMIFSIFFLFHFNIKYFRCICKRWTLYKYTLAQYIVQSVLYVWQRLALAQMIFLRCLSMCLCRSKWMKQFSTYILIQYYLALSFSCILLQNILSLYLLFYSIHAIAERERERTACICWNGSLIHATPIKSLFKIQKGSISIGNGCIFRYVNSYTFSFCSSITSHHTTPRTVNGGLICVRNFQYRLAIIDFIGNDSKSHRLVRFLPGTQKTSNANWSIYLFPLLLHALSLRLCFVPFIIANPHTGTALASTVQCYWTFTDR